MNNKNILYEYTFLYPDGGEFIYEVLIDYETKRLIKNINIDEKHEKITDLDFCKCDICPLSALDSPKCPAALHMVDLIEEFKDRVSHEKVTVEVESGNRTIKNTVAIQNALQSIMGVVMATSGCPHLAFLALMAIHHLPFSNDEETMVRVLGYYFVEQFLRNPQGSLQIDDLKEWYSRVESVNFNFIKRIIELEKRDSGRNAIIVLDTFIKLFSEEFSMDMVSLKNLFFTKEIPTKLLQVHSA